MQPKTSPEPSTIHANDCWQVAVTVPTEHAENASAMLIDAGALGVVSEDTVDGRLRGDNIKSATNPGPSEPKLTLLRACYHAQRPGPELLAQAAQALAQIGLMIPAHEMTLSYQPGVDWAQSWKAYFKPLLVGRRLWVVPSWERQTGFVCPHGGLVLELDPGMAFGTGQHATTALCLQAIELSIDAHASAAISTLRVLDVGCGSGILGLAAAKLGVTDVVGIDTDPIAVGAARDNAQRNQIANRLHVLDTPLRQVPGSFALIVANILAPTLVEMAAQLVQRLAPGAELILSGLLCEQVDDVQSAVMKAAVQQGRRLARRRMLVQDGWAAVSLHDIAG